MIDFTDAGLGDPAFDFTFLWAYGEWAAAHAARFYGGGPEVEAMVDRSRWWWTLYCVNRFWWHLSGARAYDPRAVIGDIRANLDALGF